MKKLLIILAVPILVFILLHIGWRLYNRVPSYAQADVIEQRYHRQLNKMREYAMNLDKKDDAQRTLEQRKEDEVLFSPPEILRANVYRHKGKQAVGYYTLKHLDTKSYGYWCDPDEKMFRSVAKVGTAILEDDSKLRIVQYETRFINLAGQEVSCVLMLDLAKLKALSKE